ncbi:lipopolysaccharide biosynthesis [Gymnodinialimonas sp. 2305UL16-5]|uniref:GumC family protein n=1 Tax=Gymnodinialimonas mytili TaxID=3126503 RepID=UPI0030B5C93F
MNIDLKFYWNLILRRLPAMMAIIIICSVVGVIMAMRAPVTYQANAVLLVEPPQIPDALADTIVRDNAGESIEIIRRQLMTRANMLDIANDLNVFENYSSMSPDTIVGNMRRQTDIRSRGGRGQPLIVTVRFEARTGRIAANVVNDYVTRITSANVEIRTDAAQDTLNFFEQEVDRLSTELELQSARITQFQTENASALPSEQTIRINRQALLLDRLTRAQRDRDNLMEQRSNLIQIFERTGQVEVSEAIPLTADERELQGLEREMSQALTIYSAQSPQVQLIQRRIDVLTEQIATQAANLQPEATGEAVEGPSVLDLQLSQIDSQIEALTQEISGLETELADLDDAIGRTPLNAITLNSLQRDYDNVRSQYDLAVERLSQASTGARIEDTARGQRISLIEAATVPNSPASPNRPRIALTGAALGIGLAGALFMMLELLNRSVRRPVEITNNLGIIPLATVPYIENPSTRTVRRLIRIASLVIIVIGIPAALWAVDTYYQPLDVLTSRVLNRLGLT